LAWQRASDGQVATVVELVHHAALLELGGDGEASAAYKEAALVLKILVVELEQLHFKLKSRQIGYTLSLQELAAELDGRRSELDRLGLLASPRLE